MGWPKFWICFAAVVLVMSIAVHAATFFGIDPLESIPSLMMLHGLVFPPFAAALYYGRRLQFNHSISPLKLFTAAPRPLVVLTCALALYTAFHFVSAVRTTEGNPSEHDGKYRLVEHGRIVREISEAEYHEHRARFVRAFSGGWMLFSCASILILTGATSLLRTTEAPEGS
jgi:hypothetical protein